MLKYPETINKIITKLSKLPGVGKKTAERYAFNLLNWCENDLEQFSSELSTLQEKVTLCTICGCLKDSNWCFSCDSINRDPSIVCVTAFPRDVYAIEATNTFKGIYNVLGALLSPLDGKTIDHLNIKNLVHRIDSGIVKEIVLAIDSTVEGDATALYLAGLFDHKKIKISRLAFGMPVGSSLDFVDEGTLSQAFVGRKQVQ